MTQTTNLTSSQWKKALTEFNSISPPQRRIIQDNSPNKSDSQSPYFSQMALEQLNKKNGDQKISTIKFETIKIDSMRVDLLKVESQNSIIHVKQSIDEPMSQLLRGIKINEKKFTGVSVRDIYPSIVINQDGPPTTNIISSVPNQQQKNINSINQALNVLGRLNNIISFQSNISLTDPIGLVVDKNQKLQIFKNQGSNNISFGEADSTVNVESTKTKHLNPHFFKSMVIGKKEKQQQNVLMKDSPNSTLDQIIKPILKEKQTHTFAMFGSSLKESLNTSHHELSPKPILLKQVSSIQGGLVRMISMASPSIKEKNLKNRYRLPKIHNCIVAEKKDTHKQPLRYRSIPSHYGPKQIDLYLNKNHMTFSSNQKWIQGKQTEVINGKDADSRFFGMTFNGKKSVNKQLRSSSAQSQTAQNPMSLKQDDFVDELRQSLRKQRFKKQSDDEFSIKVCKTESAQKYMHGSIHNYQ